MWTVIIKNNGVSDVFIVDLGINIPASSSINLSDEFDYTTLANSQDLKSFITDESLVLNNGTADLIVNDALDYLQIENLKNLKDNHYTKSELQTSGQSAIHWNNITNAPAFGSPSWLENVKFKVIDIGLSTPPSSPIIGYVYIDDLNNYLKWDGTSWNNIGSVSLSDRVINLADTDQSIYVYNGTSWDSQGTNNNTDAVMVDDDGDSKSAQYVFSDVSHSWVKIADVDFSGHLDGNSNKHDASEINVEGAYTNIGNSANTDLETVISDIDDKLADALDHNTLDEAYNEGGNGAGRTINTIHGALKLSAGTSGYAPLDLTPLVNVPTLGLSDGQLIFIDGILYTYDSVRSKWVSIEKRNTFFGRRGKSSNVYLHYFASEFPSSSSGIVIPRNAVILGISVCFSQNSTGIISVRKNNIETNICSISFTTESKKSDLTLNTDINAGDSLQCYLNGSNINNTIVSIEYGWRK